MTLLDGSYRRLDGRLTRTVLRAGVVSWAEGRIDALVAPLSPESPENRLAARTGWLLGSRGGVASGGRGGFLRHELLPSPASRDSWGTGGDDDDAHRRRGKCVG